MLFRQLILPTKPAINGGDQGRPTNDWFPGARKSKASVFDLSAFIWSYLRTTAFRFLILRDLGVSAVKFFSPSPHSVSFLTVISRKTSSSSVRSGCLRKYRIRE